MQHIFHFHLIKISHKMQQFKYLNATFLRKFLGFSSIKQAMSFIHNLVKTPKNKTPITSYFNTFYPKTNTK